MDGGLARLEDTFSLVLTSMKLITIWHSLVSISFYLSLGASRPKSTEV
jgi:hypothetical protein